MQYDVTKAGKLNLGLLVDSSINVRGKHHVDVISAHNMILLLLKKGADWKTLHIFFESTALHDAFQLDFASGAFDLDFLEEPWII